MRQDESACAGIARAQLSFGSSVTHRTRAASSRPEELVARILAEPVAERPPPVVPDYELRALLGTGGFGVVHLARHRASGRLVALKVLLPRVARDAGTRDRFRREIAVHARLTHPNVVALYDHGEAAGTFWFTMDYCAGGSVARHLRAAGGRLDLARAVPLMLDALGGLAAIHGSGVVHRDIKPHNILLVGDAAGGRWTARIGDFGLARRVADTGVTDRAGAAERIGSWPYLAPEHLLDAHVARPSADVWSIAATFYQMLAGVPPRDTGTVGSARAAPVTPAVPIRARVPTLPEPVAGVIDRALDTDVDRRYRDAEELRHALLAALEVP